MSFDLYWRPAAPPPPEHQLDRALKYKLAPKLWDHDGTVKSFPVTIGSDDLRMIGYLEALADQGVGGARELLAAIQEHGTVQLFIGDPDDF